MFTGRTVELEQAGQMTDTHKCHPFVRVRHLTGLLELYRSPCEAFQAYVSSECEKKSEQIATLWN